MKIILIAGKAQAGKSSLATYLQTHLRGNRQTGPAYTFNLADSLKEACQRFFGISTKLMYGTNEDKNQLTHIKYKNLPVVFYNESDIDPERQVSVRALLQYFGTEVMRRIDNDVWCRATIADINAECFERESEANVPLSHAIIGDVRFPNEIQYFIKEYGEDNVIIVRLTRNITGMFHISETSLDNYDFHQHRNYIEIDNSNMSEEMKNEIALQQVQNISRKAT